MTDEPGVPLGDYLAQDPRIRVSLWCSALPCTYHEKHDLEAVIARLDARGLNGRRVGIRKLAELMDKPCPACGKWSWEARPDYPPQSMGFSR